MSIVREFLTRVGIHYLAYSSAAGGLLGIVYNYNGRILDSAFIMVAVTLGIFATIVLIGVSIGEYLGLIENRKIKAAAAKDIAAAKYAQEVAQAETRAYRNEMVSFCNYIISGQASFRCKDVDKLQTFIQQGNADRAECKLLLQQWFYNYHLNLANQDGPVGHGDEVLAAILNQETLV